MVFSRKPTAVSTLLKSDTLEHPTCASLEHPNRSHTSLMLEDGGLEKLEDDDPSPAVLHVAV